jgi:DNA-binding transcriptional LysR family regulator
MNVESLKLFVEVVRRGSFAAAARAGRIDPSQVSRVIANLERELGVQLLARTTRKLSLTDAGSSFFDGVEDLVQALSQAVERAGASQAGLIGTLRLLSPVSFGLLNVVPLLPEWLRRHPDAHLDLMLNDALLDLLDEGVDLALRLGPLRESSHVSRQLASMWARICASPAYLERHGVPRRPEELANHACLLLDVPGFAPTTWTVRDRRGEQTQIAVRGPVRTSNAVALKQLALAGVGVVLQGDWIVGREIASGELVDLFPEHEATSSAFDNAIWIIQPAKARVPLKVKVFADFLLEQFRNGPPWAERSRRAAQLRQPARARAAR